MQETTSMRNNRGRGPFGKGIALLGMAILLAAGSMAATASAASVLPVTTVDSAAIRFGLVSSEPAGDGVMLSGYLDKRLPTRGPIPGEVVIEALDSNGRVLQSALSDFQRRPLGERRARFQHWLQPPQGTASLRVLYRPAR